jgi:hypothetical protein
MKKTVVNIGKRLRLSRTEWESGWPDGVEFEYYEVQQDPWYSDEWVEVDIDRETAEKVISLLRDAFPKEAA